VAAWLALCVGVAVELADADGDAGLMPAFDACRPQALVRTSSSTAET
jgi:hypothetical protein